MQVFRNVADVPRAPEGRALAVGTFDGVHRGHRGVIASATEWGRANGARVAVVTFDPHPLQVLRPDDPPLLLTPAEVKAALIERLGVDELVMVPFTEEFSKVEADRFCADVLSGALQGRHVSVGENFRFGHRAKGDAELLKSRPEFEAAIVPLVQQGGDPVSSSKIRELIEAGEIARANELLGAPFELRGEVVAGDARGRELGVPTANLRPEPGVVLPAPGVYAGRARARPAAVNVGFRPTFGEGGELRIEAYLLDFDGDLYGETLQLAFLERLRDEERFDSAEALAGQMRKDVERTREIAGDVSC